MSVRFVAYIDESGDTGLTNVKHNTLKGASEWLVLSCFLVRAEHDHKCAGWIQEILSKFRNNQSRSLHFRDLLPIKKMIACQVIATKPCRFFIVASNKRNMEGHRNDAAARVSGQTGTGYLYWWLARLLLERVTAYCEDRGSPHESGSQKVRIIFARRGGLIYRDFERYLKKLHWQSVLGTLHIDRGDLAWSVVDFEEIRVLDHEHLAGLQIADIGASAFFTALERNRPADCDPQYAKLLQPRLARDRRNRVLDFGLKTMPEIKSMGLSHEQLEIFRYYGYMG